MAVLPPSHDVCCVCPQSYPWLAWHLSSVIAGSLSDFQTFSCLLSLLNPIENSKYIFTHHSFIFCSIDNIEWSSLHLFLWLLSCLLFLLNWIWLFRLVTQMSRFYTWCLWNMQDVYLKKYVSVGCCLQSCSMFHRWHLLIFWLVHSSWFVNGLCIASHFVFKTRLCVQ